MCGSHVFFMFVIISLNTTFVTCYLEVGAASQYSSPYIPTECYSEDTTEFPPNNQFAAAGDAIWDNGAACGRQYLVRCLSVVPDNVSCANPDTIQVKIVDYANTAVSSPQVNPGTTMLLSNTAFEMLVNVSNGGSLPSSINIEYQEV